MEAVWGWTRDAFPGSRDGYNPFNSDKSNTLQNMFQDTVQHAPRGSHWSFLGTFLGVYLAHARVGGSCVGIVAGRVVISAV
jgi:hypothetical protein